MPRRPIPSDLSRALIPLLALAVCVACAKKLPSAPSDLVEGIVIYEHANFEGRSAHVTRDIADLKNFNGPCFVVTFVVTSQVEYSWNDCISSVRVAPGWEATLYRDDGYRDDSIIVTEDVDNLAFGQHDCPEGGLNDCVTSIRVRRR